MTFEQKNIREEDEILINHSLSGNKTALESLVRKYQNWIYNAALTMVSVTSLKI